MTLRIVLLNSILWPLMQFGLARLFVSLPNRWFERRFLFDPATRSELRIYRTSLHIRKWKRLLPDGERWVRGPFRKSGFASASRAHLREYVRETRRGESTHVAAILFSLLFLLWNPMFTWPGLLLLSLLLNLPCILTQRYNRAVLLRWLSRA